MLSQAECRKAKDKARILSELYPLECNKVVIGSLRQVLAVLGKERLTQQSVEERASSKLIKGLGMLLWEQDASEEAEGLFMESLRVRMLVLGGRHPTRWPQ